MNHMNPYLAEAIQIGDQLLSTATYDAHGMSWKTFYKKMDWTLVWEEAEDIYTGVSGIVFFFLALYKVTKKEKYLHAAQQGMHWVEWYSDAHSIGFYAFTSKMGIAYTFLKLYEITHDKKDLEKALAIAKESRKFLNNPKKTNDFLNGTAGAILMLMHLHAATQKSWIVDIINEFTSDLIANARYSTSGIYWNIKPKQIHPLSGFSHGSGGIGFVFIELARYFQNPAFYYIAEQAFAYENHYYDSKTKNWPCFLLAFTKKNKMETFLKMYEKGNYKLFHETEDLTQWCHGAPGIGLSRLRAIEHNTKYRKDLDKAIHKTRHTNLPSFTLCHGMGGNADLFLESYLEFHDEKYLQYAKAIADRALVQKRKLGKYVPGMQDIPSDTLENPSLFLGIAGIGYFFLRVSYPEKIPSILAPRITKMYKTSKLPMPLTSSLEQIKKSLIKNIFPRTILLLNSYASDQLKKYFVEEVKGSKITSFVRFVKSILPSLPPEEKVKLTQMYRFELFKIQQQNKSNTGLLFFKEGVQQREAKKLLERTDADLLLLSLKLVPEVSLVQIDQSYHLLKTTSVGMKEMTVIEFCAIVIKSFKKEQQVGKAVEKVLTFYQVTNDMKETATKKVLEQVREAITYGLLSS